MRVACVGSRNLPDEALSLCRQVGEWLARGGHNVLSGNSLGADQAYARGANRVNPFLVDLYIPWQGFQKQAFELGNMLYIGCGTEDMEEAAKHHELPLYKLRHSTRQLLGRNVRMVRESQMVIAYPGNPGRGTRHTIKVARARAIPVWDLTDESKRESVECLMRSSKYSENDLYL